jgi:hypothetical protein
MNFFIIKWSYAMHMTNFINKIDKKYRQKYTFGPCDLKAFNWVPVFLSRYQFYPWSQLR